MDRNGFEADERKRGLCSSLTKKAIREVERLKAYLASRSKVLQTPTPADVEDYPEERTMSTVSTLDVDGVGSFFGLQGNDAVVAAIGHLRKLFTPPLRLGDFADIHSSHIDALEAVGIRTNNQLLRWGAAAQAARAACSERGDSRVR